MSESKITMKLLIDSTKSKVLFAEAEKGCVDYFFHILSLPLGTVVGYLNKESMVGSVGTLYGSLESLSPNYVKNKDCLIKPHTPAGSALNLPLLTNNNPKAPANYPVAKTLYTCRNIISGSNYGNFPGYGYGNNHGNLPPGTVADHMYVSDSVGAYCPQCLQELNRPLSYVNPFHGAVATNPKSNGGYVKGVTYMIMDDLSVEPMSMVSSIAVLNKFNVRDVGSIEEREVTLDINLWVALLKASLTSKTVLTDVFLGPKVEG